MSAPRPLDPHPPQERLVAFGVDAAAVLGVWAGLLALEGLAVAIGFGGYFSGPWEIAAVRRLVIPIALAVLAPGALVAVGLGRLAAAARSSEALRRVVAGLTGGLAALVAYGVTFGRHFASLAVRAPFVALLGAVGAAAGFWIVPALARARGTRLAVLGAALAPIAWGADAFVLPRLYPAFHAALGVATLAAAALIPLSLRRPVGARPSRAVRALTAGTFVAAIGAAAWTPGASRRLATSDNLRLVLLEHAPLLGRAVRVASLIAPPPPLDDEGPAVSPEPNGTSTPRALDWTGRDVVLVSVDALRADHVSAYGYTRPTTPHFDALAREGALFTHAYCPTPHTSYSITSLMTGKYMRPLLALGLGEDSETWAAGLRRYGYRTAAFYPPAVFFIDEDRFTRVRDRELDFEYAKVEFAGPSLRADQVESYLSGLPAERPLFLWVHFFEPHEPYVMHAEHPFGDPASPTPVDAYDSEIAAADEGIGRIVSIVRAKRPGAVVAVTADHGEEFGDHGGRYHGTTVYEEQVRVPLVVVGPGVAPARIETVVQTIDLLPTTLSAIGIPRPARVRGRDLGPVLAGRAGKGDGGFAFAETDDYALVASGDERLVCARKVGACALYRPGSDPAERRDVSSEAAARKEELRKLLRATEQAHGRFEAAGDAQWPEALRRGLQGDAEAAEEVAALLDDADVKIRRKAGEVTYALHAAPAAAQARRSMDRDEDDEVRRWCALALVRMGEPKPPRATALLHDGAKPWRRRAALAFAEQGDPSGAEELSAWWAEEMPTKPEPDRGPSGLDFERAREVLSAIAKVRAQAAVPALVRSLEDVRLRPFVASALGAIGDPAAKGPLLDALSNERYVTARPPEARALFALGARGELRAPLERFAGVPEPMPEAIGLAAEAGLLEPRFGGWAHDPPSVDVDVALTVRKGAGPWRLLALTANAEAGLDVTLGGAQVAQVASRRDGALRIFELADAPEAVSQLATGRLAVRARSDAGVRALWIVPRAAEIPPPPPTPWTAARRE